MRKRRELAEHAGIAHQDIELLPALEDGSAQPVDGRIVGHVHGNQRGGAAQRLNLVVEFLECALGAGDGHDMGATAGQFEGHGPADAARGAGDDSDAVIKGFHERLIRRERLTREGAPDSARSRHSTHRPPRTCRR